MITADVRFRSILMTLFLVIMVATLVRFWPEQSTASIDAAPAQKPADDSSVKRHFDWAVTQLRTGHFQQAIDGFRAVLEHSPAMPEAYINTGFAQIELQQYDQAVQSFQTAADLRPGQVNAYWGLALSLEGLCDIPGAIGAMRTYIHLSSPDDPFLAKARAALWEWEQQKTTSADSEQYSRSCRQRFEQQGKS
jgi:Flp pilus assembly protein TadD